jgi:hypothetical protein
MFSPFVAFALIVGHAALVAGDVIPQYDVLLHVPVTIALAWTLRDRSRRARLGYALAYFLVFAAAAYARQLTTGMAGRHALVAGTIPWSDAQGFLSNAWRALHGLPLSSAITNTAMRPLYPLSFAATLAMVGHDVRIALSCYAAVVAILMARCASRMGDRYGWRAFAGVLVVLAWALRRHLFVFSTESLGLSAGLIAFEAFALAVGDERIRSRRLLPLAFLVLGIGLMVRPGPLLAIPILLAWIFRRTDARMALACGAAFAIGVSGNAVVVRAFGDATAPIGGEFPPILYGALHGEDFTALAKRHPEIQTVPAPERARTGMAIIGRELRERPSLLLGLGRGAVEYAVSPRGIFSFGYYDPDDVYFEGGISLDAARRAGPYRVINLVAMAGCGAAFAMLVWHGLWRRRLRAATTADRLADAAHVMLVGALVSACLTPPWITETAQLQATTLPFFAILPWVHWRAPGVLAEKRPILVWAAPLLLAAWLIVSFVYVGTRDRTVPALACGADGERAFFIEPSLFVRVTRPDERGYTIDRMNVNLAMIKKHNSKLVAPLASAATPGLGIAMVFDGCTERAAVLLDDADALARRPRGWAVLLGTVVDVDERVFDLR